MSVTNAMLFYIFHCIKTIMMTMMHMELPWLKGATGAERESAQTSGTSKQEAVPLFSPLFLQADWKQKFFMVSFCNLAENSDKSHGLF